MLDAVGVIATASSGELKVVPSAFGVAQVMLGGDGPSMERPWAVAASEDVAALGLVEGDVLTIYGADQTIVAIDDTDSAGWQILLFGA